MNNLQLIKNSYEDDGEEYDEYQLELKNDQFNFNFYIGSLDTESKLKFTKLIDSINNNNIYKLLLASCNGDISITYNNMCMFEVTKWGSDRGGSIKFSMPSKNCIDAFKEIVKC